MMRGRPGLVHRHRLSLSRPLPGRSPLERKGYVLLFAPATDTVLKRFFVLDSIIDQRSDEVMSASTRHARFSHQPTGKLCIICILLCLSCDRHSYTLCVRTETEHHKVREKLVYSLRLACRLTSV